MRPASSNRARQSVCLRGGPADHHSQDRIAGSSRGSEMATVRGSASRPATPIPIPCSISDSVWSGPKLNRTDELEPRAGSPSRRGSAQAQLLRWNRQSPARRRFRRDRATPAALAVAAGKGDVGRVVEPRRPLAVDHDRRRSREGPTRTGRGAVAGVWFASPVPPSRVRRARTMPAARTTGSVPGRRSRSLKPAPAAADREDVSETNRAPTPAVRQNL